MAYLDVPPDCASTDTFSIKFNCASTCLNHSRENLHLNILFLNPKYEILKHSVLKIKITKNPGRDSQCWKADLPRPFPMLKGCQKRFRYKIDSQLNVESKIYKIINRQSGYSALHERDSEHEPDQHLADVQPGTSDEHL